jgi:hypothetical protein
LGAYYRKVPGKAQQGALNETFGFCSWRVGTWLCRFDAGARGFFGRALRRIWWNNGINPIGTGWTRVAAAADFTSAWAAQDAAVKKGQVQVIVQVTQQLI